MRLDKFSNPVFNSSDIYSIIYQGKSECLPNMIVDNSEEISNLENISGIEFIKFNSALEDLSLSDFDSAIQRQWLMPEFYQQLDIESYIMEKTISHYQRDRAAEELAEFKRRNMFDLLRWLVYFVDTCRSKKILWGVGRGSSVASYVLFLIGVHKIDSLKFGLDWREFLK